jgi:hypothetical protein
MIAEGNNETLQSYSHYIMKADDLYLQNSASDIIAAQLNKLLSIIIPNMKNLGSKSYGF